MDKDSNKLGFWSIVLLGINGIIGSGIFLLPNNAYKSMGTASILAFLCAMILALFIALVIAENASLFNDDGGPYLYTKEAFGDFVGYEIGIVNWIAQIVAFATVVNGFVTTLSGVSSIFNDPIVKNITIAIVFLLLAILNIRGLKLNRNVNNILTISKLVPLVLFLAIGIFFLNGAHYQPIVAEGVLEPNNFSQTIFLIFYAFGGFESLPLVAGEMKNPRKNLPRAIVATILMVSLIYVLLQIVSIGILGSDLANSVVPVQDAFTKIAGPFGGAIVAAGTIVASAGACVAGAFWMSRPGVAMSENKMLPQFLSQKNKFDMPHYGIIVSMMIAFLVSLSGSFVFLSQISSVITFVIFIPTTLALIVFRFKHKERKGAFTVKGGLTIPILVIIFSVILLTQTTFVQWISLILTFMVAIPFYFVYYRRN